MSMSCKWRYVRAKGSQVLATTCHRLKNLMPTKCWNPSTFFPWNNEGMGMNHTIYMQYITSKKQFMLRNIYELTMLFKFVLKAEKIDQQISDFQVVSHTAKHPSESKILGKCQHCISLQSSINSIAGEQISGLRSWETAFSARRVPDEPESKSSRHHRHQSGLENTVTHMTQWTSHRLFSPRSDSITAHELGCSHGVLRTHQVCLVSGTYKFPGNIGTAISHAR